MKIIHVSEAELDAVLRRAVSPPSCRACALGCDVVIAFRVYGIFGVRIRCPECGSQTKIHMPIDTAFASERRTAFPITWEGIRKAYEKALEEWREMNKERRKRDVE